MSNANPSAKMTIRSFLSGAKGKNPEQLLAFLQDEKTLDFLEKYEEVTRSILADETLFPSQKFQALYSAIAKCNLEKAKPVVRKKTDLADMSGIVCYLWDKQFRRIVSKEDEEILKSFSGKDDEKYQNAERWLAHRIEEMPDHENFYIGVIEDRRASTILKSEMTYAKAGEILNKKLGGKTLTFSPAYGGSKLGFQGKASQTRVTFSRG
ncbi:MAG: hypothetical protein LC122_13690 [Chitinophagales bacterium]|nr:hypothetical protein [Chitinophagales bacterium]